MSTKKTEMDRGLRNISVSSQAADLFIPHTQEEMAGLREVTQTHEMDKLISEIRAKFNYMVDIYPAYAVIPEYDRVVPNEAMAVRPKRSNLCTAIVWWHENESRYEIMSLRVRKDRRLTSSSVKGSSNESRVLAAKDPKRAAGIIAGLRSYTDREVADGMAREMCGPMAGILAETQLEMHAAAHNFRHNLSSTGIADEVISVLDCIKEGRQVALTEHSELLEQFSVYDAERKRVQEKNGHIGTRNAMFMFRSVSTGSIILFATSATPEIGAYGGARMHHGATDSLFMKSYPDFESLPHEVKRTVMTLEVKEADDRSGLVKGVGYKCDSSVTFCSEACAFAIPEKTYADFLEGAKEEWM